MRRESLFKFASCGAITGLGAILLWAVPSTLAQVEEHPERGFKPAGSYVLSDIETLNPVNGNVSFHIPLASLPEGRGKSPGATVGLNYNSKIWDSRAVYLLDHDLDVGRIHHKLFDASAGGWRYSFDYQLRVMDKSFQAPPSSPGCDLESIYRVKLLMYFPDGSEHEFIPNGYLSFGGYYQVFPDGYGLGDSGGTCTWQRIHNEEAMSWYSVDGTYLRLVFETPAINDGWENNSWTLHFPDGRRIRSLNGILTLSDRNNNSITIEKIADYNNTGRPATLITDDLNRQIRIEYSIPANTIDYIHAKGANGEDLTWTVDWTPVSANRTYIATNDSYPNVTYTTPTVTAVQTITLPQIAGQSQPLQYSFTYNAGSPRYGWGELRSIETPGKARATYGYQYDDPNSFLSPLETEFVLQNRIELKDLSWDSLIDGVATTTVESWQYSNTPDVYSTVTSPDGGVTKHYYGPNGFPKLVYRIEQPDGTMTEKVWKENRPYGLDLVVTGANPYVQQETISKDGVQTLVRDYLIDKNGNTTQAKETDLVSYPPGITRTIRNTFYYSTSDNNPGQTAPYDPNAYHLIAVSPLSSLVLNGIASTLIRSGDENGQPVAYSEFFYDTRFNLTEQRSWDTTKQATLPASLSPRGSGGNSVVVSHAYDSYGNRTFTYDGLNIPTVYTYGPVAGPQGNVSQLYVTSMQAGSSGSFTITYTPNFYSGLVTASTDYNGATSTVTYDAYGRPTLTKAAGLAWTRIDHDDLNRRVIQRSDLNTTDDAKLVQVYRYDSLGRINLVQRMESSGESPTDPNTGIKAQTLYKYSGQNSFKLVSNPYRTLSASEPTAGWTLTKFDRGGRVIEVTTFSGAAKPAPWGSNISSTGTVATSYNANFTTVTDQAGNPRRSLLDGLGRLVRVDEADKSSGSLGSTAAPVQPTYHRYDPLGNLTCVTQGGVINSSGQCQGGQVRTFVYSSLSRLVSSSNPESGIVSYGYDDNGNLRVKTDARGVVTTYDPYDSLNRPTRHSYSGGPPEARSTAEVLHSYDSCGSFSIGRLCSTTAKDSSGTVISTTAITGYDALGRVTGSQQVTSGQSYMMGYSYNLAGGMTSQTYPSGRVVTTEFDDAGRVAGVKKSASLFYAGASKTDPNRIQYASHGAAEAIRLGNGLWEQTRYNARLQPAFIGLGPVKTLDPTQLNTADSNLLLLSFQYQDNNGDPAKNNGNMSHQTIRAAGALNLTQQYLYDRLNRLTSVTETGGANTWSQAYDYDRFGNRWVTAGPEIGGYSTWVPQAQTAFDASTNRLVSPSWYDESGNLKADNAGRLFKYDAENKQVEFNPNVGGQPLTQYAYDGDGRRVQKVESSGTTVYVYNIQGQLLAEYATQPPSSPGNTSYLTRDHLGSTRIVTDASAAAKTRHDYLPFGEEVSLTNVSYGGRLSVAGYTSTLLDGPTQKFTSKERDSESNLDYFGARYFSGAQGRFTSVDPYMPSADVKDPQSWNRFVYGRNNPLRYFDPDGLDWTDLDEEQRRVFQTYAERYNKQNKTTLTTEQVYNTLNESQMATFESVTYALKHTQLVDQKGNNMGNALQQVAEVTAIAGEVPGAKGDKQFRVYGNLKQGAIDKISKARDFEYSSNRGFLGIQIYHAGFPHSYRQIRQEGVKGMEAGVQPSYSQDRLRADIDVDYRFSLAHLQPANSDVRAPGNYQKFIDRWPGLRNWWDKKK